MTTTLNSIRQHYPCIDGWKTLLDSLGKIEPDDELITFEYIMESNDILDAIWCLRTLNGYDKEKRLFAVGCAREIQHMVTSPIIQEAIDIAEKFANEEVTIEELEKARNTAQNIAWELSTITADDVGINTTNASANDAAYDTACTAIISAISDEALEKLFEKFLEEVQMSIDKQN